MWLGLIIWAASCAVELTICDDKVEINAAIKVDPALMEYLKQSLDDELELGYFRGRDDADVSVMESVKDNALHELLKEELPEIASKGNAILTNIHKYEERSQQKGAECLKAISDHIETKLNLTRDKVTPLVKTITSDYITTLKKYFTDLAKEKPVYQVDEEYLILDMFNVVPLVRSNFEKNLLSKILTLAPETSDEEIEILTGTVLTFIDNDKRQELDLMCAKFKVCRPNPRFSDYLYKLLDEVLKLKNDRFQYFLSKCSELLLSKQSFFSNVLRNDIASVFVRKMNHMVNDMVNVTEMREAVSFLHSIIIRRYKINYTNDRKLQMKAKSAYIIFDIVDTAFGIDGNDLYGTQMEKTISSITEWPADIDRILYDFIQYVIEAMNYNLTQRARDEIIALADVIFYDKTDTEKGPDYLWIEGSKFVKGMLNRPEPKKLW